MDPQDFGFLDPDPKKICRSTDPDSRGKISTKNCKKKTFLLQEPKSELLKKERL